MEKVITLCLLLSIGTHILAQSNSTKEQTKQFNNQKTTVLRSEGSYNAFYYNPSKLSISDPVLNFINARANGSDVKMRNSPLAGERKHTYGFADGHLLLRSTGATSSGTITGSGAVATGSTPGSLGTSGYIPGVNGKSPYAGPSTWGTAITGQGINLNDSSIRPASKKRSK
jgi:hypothetical protein